MNFILCLCITLLFSPASALDLLAFLDNISLVHAPKETKPLSLPDPYNLLPQWWHYYDAEDQELVQRVANSTSHLLSLYNALSYEDQQAASPLINSFNASLIVLSEARKEKSKRIASHKEF